MRHLAILACLLLAPLAVQAEIPPETRWADPSHVSLDIEFPGDGYHANWELFRCDCGDLLVHSELQAGGDSEVGETLMVQRRVVLSRGFGDQQEELGASLDAPALMMQLTARLLDRAEPGGPSKVTAVTGVEAREEIMNIMLDTGTAVGGFQAPWSVKGRLEHAGDTRRRFDLKFTFSVRDQDGEQNVDMHLRGMADYARTAFPVAPSEPLDGWLITWRDPADKAANEALAMRTLEELRQLLDEVK